MNMKIVMESKKLVQNSKYSKSDNLKRLLVLPQGWEYYQTTSPVVPENVFNNGIKKNERHAKREWWEK